MKKLKVSEMFVSVQGEGPTAGRPAVFLRLTGCTLRCKWCDTIEVWKKGNTFTVAELWQHFVREGWAELLGSRKAMLVITGGDPLIHEEALHEFLMHALAKGGRTWEVELETQGTSSVGRDLDWFISRYNVSVKLANSGEPTERRLVKGALEFFAWAAGRNRATLKFPVDPQHLASELEEIKAILDKYSIDAYKTYLMPVSSTREQFIANSQAVIDACIVNGYRFSPRLQLVIWDKATGV